MKAYRSGFGSRSMTHSSPWVRTSVTASGALTGLLLRHVPGISSATLTFVDPVYRWERPVQLGVTLPE